MARLKFADVIVATVLPFTDSGAIDWPSYTRLLEYCATPEGIGAVFPNGHAGEGSALSADERARVIEVTRDFVGPDVPLLAGVIAYSTAEAITQARDAKSAGADVAVLFPLPAFAAGGTRTLPPRWRTWTRCSKGPTCRWGSSSSRSRPASATQPKPWSPWRSGRAFS